MSYPLDALSFLVAKMLDHEAKEGLVDRWISKQAALAIAEETGLGIVDVRAIAAAIEIEVID